MILTNDEIKNGYWYHHRPPTVIKELESYNNSEDLALCFTDTKSQKEWCKVLPTLNNVKHLWILSNIKKETFESICSLKSLETLELFICNSINDISSLQNLQNLKHLSLGGCTKVESLDTFKTMNLITLHLENIKKLTTFDMLDTMLGLEGLAICGSMWTTQKIDNFEFISKLVNLKYLDITNTRSNSKNFTPLLNLKQLKRFSSSFFYPQEEFEKLRSLPSLKYSNIPILLF